MFLTTTSPRRAGITNKGNMDTEMMVRQYINKNWCYGDLEHELGKTAADIAEYHYIAVRDEWHVFDDVCFQVLRIVGGFGVFHVVCVRGNYCDCTTHAD